MEKGTSLNGWICFVIIRVSTKYVSLHRDCDFINYCHLFVRRCLLDLIDAELGKFCEQIDAQPSEVFEVIESYLRNNNDEEFIPVFLKTMNEEHFFEQMHSYASEANREAAVVETLENEEKGETSMSGIYYFVPESVDKDDLNVWLDVMGMPWPFKKLFLSAHKKPMKTTIVHIPKHKFEICLNIPFFGNVLFDVKMDGQWCVGKDRIGRPLQLLGEESENGDVTLHVKDRGGALMMIFLSMTSSNTIRMHREFYINGVDSGTPGADAVLTCSFRK